MKHESARMRRVYRAGWLAFRALFRVYLRWKVYSPHNVPLQGPVILASNHASFFDPPIIGAGIPREICYLARKTLFRFPPVAWLFRQWNAVPVDRDGGSASGLRTFLALAAAGRAVILFPEGTRSRDGRLQPARSGVGLLAVKSGVPVVPVRVFGSYEAWNRRMLLPRPRRVSIKYGKPMTFERWRAEAEHCPKERLKEIYQAVSDEIMEAIARLEPCED